MLCSSRYRVAGPGARRPQGVYVGPGRVPRIGDALRWDASPVLAAWRQHSSGTGTRVVCSASPNPAPVKPTSLPYAQHKWMWRGHTINVATAGCGDPIILVHGFGLSSSHFRRTIQELSKSYKVYAPDLLGFGGSSKPIMQYSMEVWRDQVLDFMAEFTDGRPAVLVGNSIGGLTCLMAAADASPGRVRGVVLLNTAGAMNNKVAAAIFNNVRTKENIKAALTQVYSNKDAVTDELVDLVYAPSCDANAREVFVSVITGPPGPNPLTLVPRITCPLLVLWGDKDALTPADGPIGKYFQALPNTRPDTTFTFLPDVGHCLHDDKPELVHGQLLPWLSQLHSGSATACEDAATPRAETTSS